jgi:thiol-disulfide isomerase/thioredoxin
VASARLPDEGELPSLDGATGWLNSPPLTPAGLRGKVVLADFWTYTGINWLRQLPYLQAWAEKYSGHGLVVIGVHTPEFSFEHSVDNVRLAEAGSADTGTDLVSVEARGLEAPAEWASLRSPENYTGYGRTENFASPGGAVPGKPHLYTIPARLGLNQWALSGDWTIEDEAATLNATNGQIACRFRGRDLNLVMGPAAPETPVRCRVLIDGQPPARHTEATSTAMATARSRSSVCTSSSASPAPSPAAPSRSPSPIRGLRPTHSPSASF